MRGPVRGRSVCRLRHGEVWLFPDGFWQGLGPPKALAQPLYTLRPLNALRNLNSQLRLSAAQKLL